MAKKKTKKRKGTALSATDRAILAGANADTQIAYAPKVSAFNRELSVEAGQQALIDRAYQAYRGELQSLMAQRSQAMQAAQNAQLQATQGAQAALSAVGEGQKGYLGQQAQITGAGPVDASANLAGLNAGLALQGQAGAQLLSGLGGVAADYAGRAQARSVADQAHATDRHRSRMADLRTRRTELAGEMGQFRAKALADRTQQQEENDIAAASVDFKRDQEAFDQRMERLKYQADREDAANTLDLKLADGERADRALDIKEKNPSGKKGKNRYGQKWEDWNRRLIRLRDSYGSARDGGNFGGRKGWAEKGEGAWRKQQNKGDRRVSNAEIIVLRQLTTGNKKLRNREGKRAAEELFGKGRVPKWML